MTQSNTIDMRSDTVTKPTSAMWEAMANAEVGDDVYGEDPTINKLEMLAAEILGKEAAVYVSSGTMGNLISVLSHCQRGDEMILGTKAHIFMYEAAGAAAIGGIQPRTILNRPDGTLDLDEVVASLRPDDEHQPPTRLLALENTQNLCGGAVLPVDYMDAAGDVAHDHGLKLHIDGARIWNAAVALDVTPARLVAKADSISACLSKGLAAPVGSVVAGDADFIARARRMRKQVGGGMRQAGVIAAAGVIALTEMVDRLAEDHANAKLLAQGLSKIDGIQIDPDQIQSNLVYYGVDEDRLTRAELSAALAEHGVLIGKGSYGTNKMRAVTSYQISSSDIEHVLTAFEAALAS